MDGSLTRFDHIQAAISRLLSAIYYGESRWMLSSEAYRRRDSRVCGMIDATFWLLFRETDHCKKSYEWELEHNE
jgi:hypothetical protein